MLDLLTPCEKKTSAIRKKIVRCIETFIEIGSQVLSPHQRESKVCRENRQNGASEGFIPLLTWALAQTCLSPNLAKAHNWLAGAQIV